MKEVNKCVLCIRARAFDSCDIANPGFSLFLVQLSVAEAYPLPLSSLSCSLTRMRSAYRRRRPLNQPRRAKKGAPISRTSGTVRHLARFQRRAKSRAVCGELAPMSFFHNHIKETERKSRSADCGRLLWRGSGLSWARRVCCTGIIYSENVVGLIPAYHLETIAKTGGSSADAEHNSLGDKNNPSFSCWIEVNRYERLLRSIRLPDGSGDVRGVRYCHRIPYGGNAIVCCFRVNAFRHYRTDPSTP